MNVISFPKPVRQMDVNEITALASIVVDCYLIVQIIIIYRHYKYPTLRFLLLSILLLVVADLEPITKYFTSINFGDSVIITSIDMILRGFAVLSLLLVLEASTKEKVFIGQNLLLVFLLVCVSTGVLVTAGLMKSEESVLYAGLGHIDFTPPTAFSEFGLVLLSNFLFFLFIGDVMIVVQIALIIINLAQQKRESPNLKRQKNILNLQIGCYVLIVGSCFTPLLPFIGDLLMMFGFLFLIWNTRQTGDLLLYEPSLRYLIVMDSGGVPVFSFSFQLGSLIELSAPRSQDSPDAHREALYSGAISGISSLISEMVDSKQTVEQIILNRDIVIVRQVLGSQYAILLFTGRATKLFLDALDKFSQEIVPVLETITPLKTFSPENVEHTSQLVAKHFGPNVQSILK